MKYPHNLKENGTIGFVAPSFGCATDPYLCRFQNALKEFEGLGYRYKLGPNVYEASGVGISNTPKKCAEELMAFYEDKESDVLLSCGGGELMCEILEYMDFDKIGMMDPKWYMGYSDNTNFTYLLTTLCDTASIYGPCAPAFGRTPWHASLTDAIDVLSGKKRTVASYDFWEKEAHENAGPLDPYNVTEPCEIKTFHMGDKTCVTGRLLGGCMDCLVNLPGTPFDGTKDFVEKYKEDGIIWFLEACELNVFAIRRAMWQLEQAGWFQYVKAFLFGRPAAGGEIMGLDEYEAVLKVAGKYNVPVICDLDIGHLPPMMPLILGSMATVTVDENHISIKMEEL